MSKQEARRYITEPIENFTEDLEEDLDDTICAKCNHSPSDCKCSELPEDREKKDGV